MRVPPMTAAAATSPSAPGRALSLDQKFLLAVWLGYLATSPLYVFRSGNPQPADLAMALLILIVLSGSIIRIPFHQGLYLAGICTAAWCTAVNLVYFSIHEQFRFLMSALYYGYNFGHILVIIALFERFRDRFIWLTCLGLLATVVLELAMVILAPGWSSRAQGTFNNPNQLGYWALLTIACWIVLKGRTKFNSVDLLVIGATTYLAAKSLSKAALGGVLVLAATAIVCQGFDRRFKLGLVCLLLLATSAWLLQPERINTLLSKGLSEGIVAEVIERFEAMGRESDSGLSEGRGYDRIWRHPEYLLFGAGEGAYERFLTRDGHALELHSTWGTILFSYGIVGSVLFTITFVMLFRNAPFRSTLYFMPLFFYGITHQGLRFSLLWVFLGLVFVMARHDRLTARAAAGPQAAGSRAPRPPARPSHPPAGPPGHRAASR